MFCGPAIGYAFAIFIFSTLHGHELPNMHLLNFDKIVHFLEFGLFGMFLYRVFRLYRPFHRPFLLTLIVGVPYAALDEIHQYFVPGRECSGFDFAFDIIGLVVFAAVSVWQHGRRS